MRNRFLISLVILLVTAATAGADFGVKGWVWGLMVEPMNLPVPENLEMNGDPSGPEFIVMNCYNGQCEIGLADVHTGTVEWIYFSDWSVPPEHVAYLDIDNDGLLDALIQDGSGGVLALGCTSGAAVNPPVGLPESRAAASSYPNPVNSRCQVAFSFSRSGSVTVEVFDPAGRLVRQLLSAELTGGFYSPVWDGQDDAGIRAQPGVYFVRIRTPESEQSVKLVLAR